MATIFDYTNYREYLRDFLQEQKKLRNGAFSHKAVLAALGVSSTGFISNLFAGRKNLTPVQAMRMGEILRFSKSEAAFFEALVQFTQARSFDEKNEYLKRMMVLQQIRFKQLSTANMSLFSQWYFVVIRELVGMLPQPTDHEKLGALLLPRVSASAVGNALATLEKLGLVRRRQDGGYEQADAAITTGDEVQSVHLANFQLATMDLAKEALKRIPATQRDISVMTMTLSPDSFRLTKAEIQYLRKRLAKTAIEEKNPTCVYQLNIQLFPVTRNVGGADE